MKRIMSVFIAVMLSLMIATVGFAGAGQDKDGPGWYEHSKTGAIKWFDSHPGKPSQWNFVSGDPLDPPTPPKPCCGVTAVGNKTVGGYSVGIPGMEAAVDPNNSYNFANTFGIDNSFAENNNIAKGLFAAFQHADAYIDAKLCSFAWTIDYGLTSKSFAMSILHTEAGASGYTFSDPFCGKDYSESSAIARGTALQANGAGEVSTGGYSVGWNSSEASFEGKLGYKEDFDSMFAHTSVKSEGAAGTIGSTIVNSTPGVNVNSSWGITSNSSWGNAGVAGSGTLQTAAYNNSGAFASTVDSFSYKGGTNGTGYATGMSMVSSTPGHYTARATGSSFSKVGGNSNPR